MTNRWDETWHRLREWTNGQAPSERLSAQILIDAGFDGIDPSHPLGGRDGGKDALSFKQGKKWGHGCLLSPRPEGLRRDTNQV